MRSIAREEARIARARPCGLVRADTRHETVRHSHDAGEKAVVPRMPDKPEWFKVLTAAEPLPMVWGAAGGTRTFVGKKAVLLDLDDTLTPEVKVWPNHLKRMMRNQGVGPEHYAMFDHGLSATALTQAMFDLGVRAPGLAPDRPAEEHAAWMRESADRAVVAAINEKGREFMPGADRLLDQLSKSEYRVGLVTSASESITDASLTALENASRHGFDRTMFDAVITLDTVTNPKPNAEPYARGAAALGVEPAECMAVEDSPTGVEAAKSAGIGTIFAVAHRRRIPRAPNIHRVSSLKLVSVSPVVNAPPRLVVEPPPHEFVYATDPATRAPERGRGRGQGAGKELGKA
jgi:HAD superfamily hydrolase (TIGR01509 family)